MISYPLVGNALILVAGPLAVLLSLYFISYLSEKRWYAPGPFVSMNVFFHLLAFAIFGYGFPIYAGGLWFFVVLVGSFVIGSTLGKSLLPKYSVNALNREYITPVFLHSNLVMVLSLVVGLGSVVAIVSSTGMSLSSITSVDDAKFVSNTATRMRYDGVREGTLIISVLSIGIYLGALLGGALYVNATKIQEKIIAFSPVLLALISGAAQTTKATILYSLVLWIGSATATIVLSRKTIYFKKMILPAAVAMVALLLLMLLFMALRYDVTASDLAILLPKLRVYSVGHISVFTQWFHDTDLMNISPAFGWYTFGGIFDLLGLHIRKLGIFTKAYVLYDGIESNVYTAIRSLIDDFTLLGSIVFVGLFGMIFSFAYRGVQLGKPHLMAVLAGSYAIVMFAFVASIVAYNSIIIALVLYGLYLYYYCRLTPAGYGSRRRVIKSDSDFVRREGVHVKC